MIDSRAPLACPLCASPLQDGGKSWYCEFNHHFDLARQGYLNLLPASQKTSRDPGDSKAMVQARRTVFTSALFAPFADELARKIRLYVSSDSDKSTVVLDAACGEGYYTNHIAAAVREESTQLQPIVMGVDISKWGIMAAARAYTDITWLVGNNKRLPVLPGSIDIISSVFGFETWKPWAALQVPGQTVLVAHAGPQHLLELRELIYDKVVIHAEASDEQAVAAGYQQVERSELSYQTHLSSVDMAMQVLAMTPHGYRIPAEKYDSLQTRLSNLTNNPLTIDIVFRWYQR